MECQARCHCGCVGFSFRSPAVTTRKRCNCSVGVRRGAVLSSSYLPAADFTSQEAPRDLGVYFWNEHGLGNYLCTTCGIFLYVGDGENAMDGYRVNLDCDVRQPPLNCAPAPRAAACDSSEAL